MKSKIGYWPRVVLFIIGMLFGSVFLAGFLVIVFMLLCLLGESHHPGQIGVTDKEVIGWFIGLAIGIFMLSLMGLPKREERTNGT